MLPSIDFGETQRRHWRRSLLIGAGLVTLYFPLDLLYPAGRSAALWRGVWVLCLLAAAALQLPASPRLTWATTHLAAAISGLAATAVVLYAGGSAGARFGFLQSLPLATMLLLPHLPSVTAAVAAGSLGGGALIIAREGRGALFALEWGMLSFALCALAALGATGFRTSGSPRWRPSAPAARPCRSSPRASSAGPGPSGSPWWASWRPGWPTRSTTR